MKVEALGSPHNQHGNVYFVWENEGRGGQNCLYLQQFSLLPPRQRKSELLKVEVLLYRTTRYPARAGCRIHPFNIFVHFNLKNWYQVSQEHFSSNRIIPQKGPNYAT